MTNLLLTDQMYW